MFLRKLDYARFIKLKIFAYFFPILFEFLFEQVNVIFPYLSGPLLVQAGVIQRKVDARFESSIDGPDSVGSKKENPLVWCVSVVLINVAFVGRTL